MTQRTTVFSSVITLKEDTEMSTGYRGRGMSSVKHVFPKGTRVAYQRLCFNGRYVAHDGEEITEIKHYVTAVHEGEKYQACKVFVPEK